MRVETIGDATLFLGDCMEILPTLGKVDAVVTDPPYGISADKKGAHSSIRDAAEWSRMGWDEARPPAACFQALLASAPAVAIWGGNYFADMLPASAGWLCWRKPEAETGFSLADVELCWTNQGFAARTKTFQRRDGNEHPTQKPVAVMAWAIGFLPGTVVMDPFMGSGTTGVATLQLGRKFIGIEREPKYFDIACRRIEQAANQGQLFTPAANKPEQMEIGA